MSADTPDYRLSLSGYASGDEPASTPAGAYARPFLNVQFRCCDTAARVYRSADGRRYVGHCPRCAAPVRFRVGEGGVNARSFVVG